ncbi:MAG: type II toxin-antitoxin system PemK/MazF family toxin [Synergistaceae bacterium]|nr:type II toxin-antitoxin system PemK/MazF family toxin [Synergistaceae bacterium]
MPSQFNRGDIFYADFPFEENSGKSKERTVFVWGIHPNGEEVLASKITSVIRGLKWEVLLSPGTHSGIKKLCVVRVDQTRYLSIRAFCIPLLGTLNPFEIAAVEQLFREFTSPPAKENSPTST